MNRRHLCDVVLFWREVSYAEVLGYKSTMYIRVNAYWSAGYLTISFGCTLYCGCLNLFCNVWVCVCVGFVMCGCFGNMCTCIYCVLYCLYYVFRIVSFMCIYSYLFCLYRCKDYCHRVTTQLQLVVVAEAVIIIIIIIVIIIIIFPCGAAAHRRPWPPHSRGF